MSPKNLTEQDLLQREYQILDAALDILQQGGPTALSIDKLVPLVPYSKGTIYNHFSCKEDILTALCNRSLDRLTALFTRAADFAGNTREQALAMNFAYMLHAKLNPTEFMLVLSAKTATVTEKTSDRHQQDHTRCEEQLTAILSNVFLKAVALGDLPEDNGLTLHEQLFACWSTGFGSNALLAEHLDRCGVRHQMQVEQAMMTNQQILFDGMGWHPLRKDHDWQTTYRRFKDELFAPEIRQLEERGITLSI